MTKKVKIKDIIDAMEMQFDEYTTYLNIKTGEVVTVSHEECNCAENDEPVEELPDWQQEQINIAKDIIDSDNYIALPDKYNIHEWDIMRRFCQTIEDDGIKNEMLDSIHGSGAFRYFKDNLMRNNISDDWYKFRYNSLKEIAEEWCRENNVEYEY